MQRAIVAPAVLPDAALDELKDWLAITTTREDAALTALLRASLDTCEAFTRQAPLETLFEELHEASKNWQMLSTAPVRAITVVEAVADDGTRTALDAGDYLLDLTADGCGLVRLMANIDAGRIAVRFTAGLVPDWASLPEGLKHGVIRLAAHYHRARDEDVGAPQPPAAVAALWQGWRRMRLT